VKHPFFPFKCPFFRMKWMHLFCPPFFTSLLDIFPGETCLLFGPLPLSFFLIRRRLSLLFASFFLGQCLRATITFARSSLVFFFTNATRLFPLPRLLALCLSGSEVVPIPWLQYPIRVLAFPLRPFYYQSIGTSSFYRMVFFPVFFFHPINALIGWEVEVFYFFVSVTVR